MKTGVYLDRNRYSAIVVKVKHGDVWYLTFMSGVIQLLKTTVGPFEHEFNLYLESYPVGRAVKKYWEYEFRATPEAYKVMQVIVGSEDAARRSSAIQLAA